MDILKTLKGSLEAAKRRSNLIIFFAITHVAFLILGQWMVAMEIPGVLRLRDEQLIAIRDLPYLKPLTGALAGSLPLKILYTFLFNLIFGAFFSTTLTGVIFFLPYLTAVWRSFLIGVLVYGAGTTPWMPLVFYGTFILEFGAYCVSSAVGTDIGLTLIWPSRKGMGRKEALISAVRDGVRLYFLVIVILFTAACWEISWLHYLGPLINIEGPR